MGGSVKVKIICAGMHRSGSTWMYNAVRQIYLNQGYNVYGCFANKYDFENKTDIHVLKVHEYKESVIKTVNYFLLSYRDVRDIAASAIRRNLISENIDEILAYTDNVIKREYEPWKKLARYEMRYEQMYQSKIDMVSEIAKAINMPIQDATKIKNDIESLKPPSTQEDFDEENQLHCNHITNGIPGSYITTLSKEMIAAIENRHGKWLKDKEYLK